MARLKDRAISTKDLFMFNPRDLRQEEGRNARHMTPELREHLNTLKGSIAAMGVLQPLTVFAHGDDLIITDGHCRHTAVMELLDEGVEIAAVPVRLEEKGTNDADRVLSMLTRNGGKPLTALETAEVVKQLLGFGWDVAKVSAKTGIPGYTIARHLELLEAPAPVLAMVERGEVSASLAVAVVKASPADAPAILQEAGEIAYASGSTRTAPKHVREAQEARQEAQENPTAPKKARIDWPKVGPKLKRLVEDAITATDNTKPLKRLSDFYEATFGA
jgi:ParB-like chromosome segregation protein Spo0J